ncbi:MAG: glycine oxidase ThiO [bacterium]
MQTSDVVIIGGGLIGLCCARWLCRAGFRVVLLERDTVGKQASWAAAGMLAPHFESPAHPPFYSLCLKGLEMYQEFSRELFSETGIRVGYRNLGALALFFEEGEIEDSRARLQWFNNRGADLAWLSQKEVLEREPELSRHILKGQWIPKDHQINNRQLLLALTRALIQDGVEIYEKQPVTDFLIQENKVKGVQTHLGAFYAGWVVNAAGCWAGRIDLNVEGARFSLQPLKGQMVALDMRGIANFKHVIHGNSVYLVPRESGHLLLGATEEEAGFDNHTTVAGIQDLLTRAMTLSPKIDQMPILSTWSGLRPCSQDRLPILGPTPLHGYLIAAGHFRNGILLAPITAKLIAEFVLSGHVPELMQPFLLQRFL